ncbi:MAG: TRAP transporter large permease subunit, partial [Marivita lacus]|nr:TRAP transporter large permease subunit [Marivita lacus]
ILTINMEIGLITPPVGLNLYVINGIAPDISLKKILVGSFPFVVVKRRHAACPGPARRGLFLRSPGRRLRSHA